MAGGYAKEINELNFHDKLLRLERLADLNPRTKTNCLHVSLNFDPKENLEIENLQEIAKCYMQKIGFGAQPFLVYLHHDAAHQHIHVVSTNIKKDGKRISMHNLGRNESEQARKEIEKKFDLVEAETKQKNQIPDIKSVNVEKAIYGKLETKRAISNIVTAVVGEYKFTSLNELNAALKQFNVIADPGAEGSRMFQNRGLKYSLLDERGNKIGVPVKASSIYGNPTLKSIENKFERGEAERKPHAGHVCELINRALGNHSIRDMRGFQKELYEKGMGIVCSVNEQGFLYGITYVDHHTKCVFKGSDLGKQYSAAIIRERLQVSKGIAENPKHRKSGIKNHPRLHEPGELRDRAPIQIESAFLHSLLDPVKDSGFIPWQLKRKRKRKKRTNP